MEVVTGQNACTQALAKLATEAETTYGLVFLTDAALTADDVITIKEAGRVCDKAIVVSLSGELSQGYTDILAKAGADLLYVHKKPPQDGLSCQLIQRDGVNITGYLSAILLIMPSVVVAHQETLTTLKAVKSIEKTFYQLFTLIEVGTPKNILSKRQQELVDILMLGQEMLDHGERRVEPLLQQVLSALDQHQFKGVQQLALFDADTLQEVKTTLPAHSFLFAEVKEGEHLWRRSVKLRT